jgi:predicted transcriptional regulator
MANTKAARGARQPRQVKKAQPAKDVVVTLRVDPDTLTQLDFIAKGMDRSRANVCAIALREFVEREYPFHQAVAEGLEDINAGRVVPHDKVSDWIRGMEEGRVTEPPLSGR